MFSAIHHVAIICSDYQRAKYFYTEILGLKILRETFRSSRQSYKLDLQVGESIQIELFSFPKPPARMDSPEACGLRHLAFLVADLDKAIHHLIRHDIQVEAVRVDEMTGKRFTFFKDPDGLPLELYQL